MEFQKTGAEADENLVVGSVIKALSFDPLYAERYSKLGFYYYQFGNLDLARTYVKMGLTISPDQFSAWMLLAKIYQLQNKGPQMLFALEKAYKLNSDNKQMQQVWQIAKTEPNIHKVPLYVAFGQDKLE